MWETGGETAGGSPSLSPAQVCPSLPPHPPPSPPLAPHLPLLSCPLAQCTVLSRPPDLPHFMKPCPLLSLQHCWPQGDRERAPRPTQTCTRAHTRHTVDTPRHKYTGLRLQGPRGGCVVSLAFRAQPAPETALGQASPGQAGAKRLGLPSSGPRSRAGEGAASLHSRHCLKENGDRAHLAGLWRDLPVCPSGSQDLPHFFSISKSGRKGAKQENGSQSPSPRAGLAEDGAGTS